LLKFVISFPNYLYEASERSIYEASKAV